MQTSKLVAAAALTLVAGLAHAAFLPSTVHFTGFCDFLTNVTYVGPPIWGQNLGWYTATLDGSACPPPVNFNLAVSGPEAKKVLAYQGKSAAIAVHDPVRGPYFIVINDDFTWQVVDWGGNPLGSGVWTP